VSIGRNARALARPQIKHVNAAAAREFSFRAARYGGVLRRRFLVAAAYHVDGVAPTERRPVSETGGHGCCSKRTRCTSFEHAVAHAALC
jgi:hypothetical protein